MARGILFICGIYLLCWQADGNENNKYDDYLLLRLYPKASKEIDILNNLEKSIEGIEILKKSRSFNDTTDILVPPNQLAFIRDIAHENGITFDVKENYGRTFDPAERTPRRRILRGFDVFEYHSYAAMQEHLDMLTKRHPELISMQTLGESYQRRRVRLVKISSNPKAGNPIIFIDAGIHAREWVAPAMAMYLVHRLVNDPDARRDLAGVDWYILPVVNPDGYEYTRANKVNRLWRKTRSKNTVYGCFGVDGNRNYGYKWAVSGVSKNPCDQETYAGPKPFSEPETQMVRNVMMEYGKRIKLYVSLHSYGQYLVYPWGYTGDFLPKEWQKLDSLARMVSNAVENAGGQPFRVMSAGKWYPAAGGSDDFAFGAIGVPYSYTMELTDGYEFLFPERLLHTVFPQYYEGFKVFATQIKNEFAPTRHKKRITGPAH
ncbi:carboxypeptidase B-like [Colias croceus]|uniref:carboxypeptidase B-like n=1 Tax=Colias crocea TaxID=72248 RepID=UPI001E27A751|nr:carboxypeptidase B-like [Colias croceus]